MKFILLHIIIAWISIPLLYADELDCIQQQSKNNVNPFHEIQIIKASLEQPKTGIKGICGKINIENTNNEQLENLIFQQDLLKEKSPPPTRSQCGLPGEKLNICATCQETPAKETMNYLRPLMASQDHLTWHKEWHLLRIPGIFNDEKFNKYQSDNWIPKGETRSSFLEKHGTKGKFTGEDFFYMHRLMIKMTQLESAAAGLPCIAPWKNLPDSVDDTNWPVPKKFQSPEKKAEAEKALNGFKKILASYQDPKKLKQISLNKLGLIIEPSLHQSLHEFYRSNPLCSAEAKKQGLCDDLSPLETSPLNMYFWKIHGMIDNLIGDWLAANGYEEIAKDCGNRKNCYQWQSPWVGKNPSAK